MDCYCALPCGRGEDRCDISTHFNKGLSGMSFSRKQRTLFSLAGAIAFAAVISIVVPAQAANQPVAKPSADANNKTMRMEQRYMQLQGELAQTQEKAFKKRPSLIKQEKHFRELFMATMKRQGTDPKPRVAELKKLRQQILDKHTDNTKRTALIAKARAIQEELLKAENKAIRDPRVAAANKKLRKDTIDEMRKVNPKTDQMIAEFEAIRKQLAKAHNGHAG